MDRGEGEYAAAPVLKIEGLHISFMQYDGGSRRKELTAIRDLDVEVGAGEMVAVVGSSGSGKSLLAHAILGLLPYNASMSGKLMFCGSELSEERIRQLRGKEIVMVPQSVAWLDPLQKIGAQIRKGRGDRKTRQQLKDIFHRYDLDQEVEKMYPFELSGGMNRRVLISTAMMEEPKLVIADEPTPGLDLSVAKRAMGHFRELADRGAGVLIITHDLELAMETVDRIVVFYAGSTVEEAPAADFNSQETLRHPYTKALWRALPQNGFEYIPGTQPRVDDLLQGCPFAPRCGRRTKDCDRPVPGRELRGGRVKCLYAE